MLITVITLLLIFWLISLVWSPAIAKNIFKIVIYLGLTLTLIAASYMGYESYQVYRQTALLKRLNAYTLAN